MSQIHTRGAVPTRFNRVSKGRPTSWSRERIVLELQRFHEVHDRWPSARELRAPWPNEWSVRRRFGSVGAARVAAGGPEHVGRRVVVPLRERRVVLTGSRMPIGPFRRALLRLIEREDLSLLNLGDRIYGTGRNSTRRLSDILERQEAISFATADRIMCRLGLSWWDDEELLEAYLAVPLADRCPVCGKVHSNEGVLDEQLAA